MNNKQLGRKFSTETVLEMILEELNNGYEGEVADLHSELFNNDCYIIGTHAAIEALEEYGVFKAIKKVKEYQEFHFGEVLTDFSCPESLATALLYVIAAEVYFNIESVNVNYDESYLDEEVSEEVKEDIEKLLALM